MVLRWQELDPPAGCEGHFGAGKGLGQIWRVFMDPSSEVFRQDRDTAYDKDLTSRLGQWHKDALMAHSKCLTEARGKRTEEINYATFAEVGTRMVSAQAAYCGSSSWDHRAWKENMRNLSAGFDAGMHLYKDVKCFRTQMEGLVGGGEFAGVKNLLQSLDYLQAEDDKGNITCEVAIYEDAMGQMANLQAALHVGWVVALAVGTELQTVEARKQVGLGACFAREYGEAVGFTHQVRVETS